MYHARHLIFIFCFYRDTVAAVAHGDDSVLQVGAGAAVYDAAQLAMDTVVDQFHAASLSGEEWKKRHR